MGGLAGFDLLSPPTQEAPSRTGSAAPILPIIVNPVAQCSMALYEGRPELAMSLVLEVQEQPHWKALDQGKIPCFTSITAQADRAALTSSQSTSEAKAMVGNTGSKAEVMPRAMNFSREVHAARQTLDVLFPGLLRPL